VKEGRKLWDFINKKKHTNEEERRGEGESVEKKKVNYSVGGERGGWRVELEIY